MTDNQNMVAEPRRYVLPVMLEPKLVSVDFSPSTVGLIDACEIELSQRAALESHGCWGYFPDAESVDRDLPASQALQSACPVIAVDERELHFSWVRFSGSDAITEDPTYHLDADAQTGLRCEDLAENLVPRNRVWRLLLNMHQSASRHFTYLNISADSLRWRREGGSVGLSPDEQLRAKDQQTLLIPRRLGGHAMGALVCVSQVPHAGKEMGDGHFLASWSLEEEAA